MARGDERVATQECHDETHELRRLVDLPVFLLVAKFLLQQTFAIGCVCKDWLGFVYSEEALSTVFSHKLHFRTKNRESLSAVSDGPTNSSGPAGGQILIGVARRLQFVKRLSSLRMSFYQLPFGENPRPLQVLYACIPAGLIHLELDFGQTDFGDDGAMALGAFALRNLPLLEELKLNLWNCAVTDVSLAAIGTSLPRSLKELDLSLCDCRHFTDTGLAFLMHPDHIPTSLVRLELDLSSRQVSDSGIRFVMDGLPAGLMEFSLKVSCDDFLTYQSLWTIEEMLPKRLKKLLLDFKLTQLAEDVGREYSDGRTQRAIDAHASLTRATAHIADCVLDFKSLDEYAYEYGFDDYSYDDYSEDGDEAGAPIAL